MRRFCLAIIMLLSLLMGGCAVPVRPFRIGQDAFNNGNYEKAIKYFKIGIEQPNYSYAGNSYHWLCVAYVRNNQHKEAIDTCQRTLQVTHLNDEEIWQNLVTANRNIDDIGAAISLNKKLIELKPDAPESYRIMAILYFRNKQYDESITAAKRAIEMKPDAAGYNALGDAYNFKGQYAEAISAYKNSLETDPKQPTVYRALGFAFERTENYDEAVEAYIDGIRLGGQFQLNLAYVYYFMGRYDEAISMATKAVEQQTIRGGIGIRINIKDNYPVVVEVFKSGPAFKAGIKPGSRIVRIDGDKTKGLDTVKFVQLLQGEPGTQVFLTIADNESETKVAITREKIVLKGAAPGLSLRGLAYRQKGNPEKAITDAKAAMEIDLLNGDAIIALGAAYLDEGQYDKSIELLSKVKDNATASLLKATALARQGKTEEAVKIYLSIPDGSISQKHIPLMGDRQALLEAFKPYVREHMDKAKSLEAGRMNKEALSELSEALQVADDSDAQLIQEEMLNVVNNNPLLAEPSEEARKYAIRGEMLAGDGNFSQAILEFKKAIRLAPYVGKFYYNCAMLYAEMKNYPEAIRQMKTYLKASADTPSAREAKDSIIKWEYMMEKGQGDAVNSDQRRRRRDAQ